MVKGTLQIFAALALLGGISSVVMIFMSWPDFGPAIDNTVYAFVAFMLAGGLAEIIELLEKIEVNTRGRPKEASVD